MKKLLLVLSLIIFCLGAFSVGTFSFMPENVAFAEDEIDEIAIFSKNYSILNSEYALSTFTPFDFSNETRMEGKSIKPSANANGTFNISIETEQKTELDKTKNYELGLWIYFPNSTLFNLKITLSGENSIGNNGELFYNVSSEELASILSKPNDSIHSLDAENDGYGWNYLEVPFSSFTNVNAANGDKYIPFNAVNLNYQTSGEGTSGVLQFYDAKIKETNLSASTVLEDNKQPYRLFKLNHGIDFNSIFLGDEINLPAKSESIKYAYIGDVDCKTNTTDYSIKATVKTTDATINWEFGSKFTFSVEGTNVVEFKVVSKSDNETQLFSINRFSVNTFVGIRINQNINSFYKGQKVAIYITENAKLVAFSDLHFEISGDCAKIVAENQTEKYVVIEMLKEGNFSLIATANGERKYDDSLRLVAEKEFSVLGVKDNDRTIRIALWIVFGVIATIGLGFGIKAIIDANKYNVR